VKPVNRWFILIAGMTGSGKSVLTETLIKKHRRVIIYDSKDEYGEPEENQSINVSALGSFYFRTKDFAYACDLAFRAGNCVLVLDDAGDYLAKPLVPAFEQMVREGRHKQVNIIVTTQRIPDLAPVARGQVDVIVVFRTTLPLDLQGLKEYGFDLEKVKSLSIPTRPPWIGEFEYVALTPKGVESMVTPFQSQSFHKEAV
jgi:DNA helicase HerA-like ATPase